jgi:plasmid stabilization system protein ParE
LERIRVFLKETADAEVMLSEAQRIWDSCQRLTQFPDSGRPGRIPLTREVVVSPYVIPYRVRKGIVEILNIFHSAQKR